MTRIIGFGGAAVAVETGAEDALNLVDFLFARAEHAAPDLVRVSLRLDMESQTDRWLLSRAGEGLCGGTDRGACALNLVQAVLYHLADDSRSGLLLHAAALSIDGRGLVFPGVSGVGKSTLAAWLSCRGYRYHTDELVHLEAGGQLRGFMRPLNLKSGSLGLIESLLGATALERDGLPTPEGLMIWPGFPAEPVPDPVIHAAAFIFPDYRPGGTTEIVRLTPAACAAQLMGCLINARNLPAYGAGMIAALVRRVPGFLVRYEELTAVERFLATLPLGAEVPAMGDS